MGIYLSVLYALHKGQKKGTPDTSCAIQKEEDENVCQGCKKRYEEDSEEAKEWWLGCNTCWRWWHFQFADYVEMPDEDEHFQCPVCSSHQ